MAVTRPFRAVRPLPAKADRVAALPYDVVSIPEAAEEIEKNPLSFLSIDLPAANPDFPSEGGDPAHFARRKLDEMVRAGIFCRDRTRRFYIYRQKTRKRAQTGLVCCTAVDDYLKETIKKHEHTRPKKEEDRIQHIESCGAHTGPIFLTYRPEAAITEYLDQLAEARPPIYDFTAEAGVQHTVWGIDHRDEIDWLRQAFGRVPALYIADGHHRSAAAVKVSCRMRRKYPDYSGDEEFNFFPSVLFPADQLQILPYDRAVRDLNGLEPEEYLRRLSAGFQVTPLAGGPFRPERKHTWGMLLDKQWYRLEIGEEQIPSADPVAALDVALLHNRILEPILGIADPRTDPRITYIGGEEGTEQLVRSVTGGRMRVAFTLHPTGIDELMEVADAGRVMPPKSTWFEPKLLSGLFLHPLDEGGPDFKEFGS